MKKYSFLLLALMLVSAVFATRLNEGFEGTTFPPEGWTVINGGDANTWFRSTSNSPHSGSAHAQITYSSAAHDDWLITPQLLPTVEHHTFSFWAKNYSTSFVERFNVKLSLGTAEISDFTVDLDMAVGPPLAYTQYTYDLENYIDTPVYLAVQAISANQFYLFVDDFAGPEIFVPASPPNPAGNPYPGNGHILVNPLGLTLSWAPAPRTESYEIYFGTDPLPNSWQNIGTDTFFALGDLAPGETYYWQVVPHNSYGPCPNSPVWSFSTLPENPLIIGQANASSRYPLGSFFGFERSVALYTEAELGSGNKRINTLGWYANSAHNVAVPTKIYLKRYLGNTITSDTWANFINGATLVYDATHQGIAANTWHGIVLDNTFDLDSGDKLLVLVERNTGGSGNGTTTGAGIRATTMTGMHHYIQADNNPPTGLSYAFGNRPDLLILADSYEPQNPPNPAILVSPGDGATGLALNVQLNWVSGGGAPTGYKVYFGETNPPPLVEEVWELTSYDPGPLTYDETYYWQIVPYNQVDPANENDCPIWSFSTLVPQALTYFEHFDSAANLPAIGWTGDMSIMANHGTNGTKGLTRNLYSGVSSTVATTPHIGPIAKNTQIMFDYRYVLYSMYPANAYSLVAGDKLEVRVAYNDGTFNTVHTIDHNNHTASTDFATVIVDIDNHENDVINVQFLATRSAGDYYLDIDNVIVRETPLGGLLIVHPDPVNFDALYIGKSESMQLTLTNTGVDALTIISIDLDDEVNFSLSDLPGFPLVINSGDPATHFTLSFHPSYDGAISANILFDDGQNSSVEITGIGKMPSEGEICENPYIITLPLENYAGSSLGLNDDYRSNMFTGLAAPAYLNGIDWVGKITVPESGVLNITVNNQSGYSNQWMGVFLINTIPSLESPAEILAQAYGSNAPQIIKDHSVTAGEYYLIIDNNPAPANFYFVLDVSFLSESAPLPTVPVYPPDKATDVDIAASLLWEAATFATGYKLYFGTDDPPTNIEDGLLLNGLSYTPANLLEYEKEYFWQVIPTNDVHGDAVGFETWSFTTMDDPAVKEFPWLEQFDTPPYLPSGWSVENLDGGGSTWVSSTNQAHSAPRSLFHDYSTASTQNGWLISPPIYLPATPESQMMLSWWNYSTWPGYLVSNTVKINTTSDPAHPDWQQVWSYENPKEQWEKANVNLNNLSNYLGQTIYVAFVYEGYNGNGWHIDDVGIHYVYEYPEGISTDTGETDSDGNTVTLTVAGGSANNYPIDPANWPAFNNGLYQPSFEFALELFGNGPWTLSFATTEEWGAYYHNGRWHSEQNSGGGEIVFQNITKPKAGGLTIPTTFGGQDPTLPVELSSFTATLTADFFVKIIWVAESETNHAGYNILRSEVDVLSTAIKINSGLINEGDAHGTQLSYQYLDKEVMENASYFYWLESLSLNGETDYYGPLAVSILAGGEEQEIPVIPLETKLYSAFPNPFNPATNLRYSMKEAGDVSIQVFNIKGQLIQSFEKSHDVPGYYQVSWNGRDQGGKPVTSGVYFYRMTSGKYSATKKMIMSK